MTASRLFLITLLGLLMLAGSAHAQYREGDEYDLNGYLDNTPTENPVVRLAAAMGRGEVELEYRGEQGYLGSLLQALGIEPASQLLIFSPTSLQFDLIDSKTPRAVYFNENVYIGWVLHSNIIELATLDDQYGLVFYTFNNRPEPKWLVERAIDSCLGCHDTQGTMGGGVPMLSALTSTYGERNASSKIILESGGNVGDRTPIKDRWGGWYVTGRHGHQSHLGNGVPRSFAGADGSGDAAAGNMDTLKGMGFFDTSHYLRSTSDIVALMVLDHQVTIQNQFFYVKFKAPAVLSRQGFAESINAPTWDALPDDAKRILTRMMDKLVQQLFFVDSAKMEDRISGNKEFQTWFLAQGVRDSAGRSLRDFDLEEDLFRYPLSYLVQSDAFDTLPAFAKDYAYRRISAVLEGRDTSEEFAHISDEDRLAISEILKSTNSEIRPYLGHGGKIDISQAAAKAWH